ncbi:unnamed protein product [Closterium sp. NIES-53]
MPQSPFEQFRKWLDLRKGVAKVLVALENPKVKANHVIQPWRPCNQVLAHLGMSLGCQEGRGEGGGRGRGHGGHGGRGGGAANMKSDDNKSESRDDRFPSQFFFVSTQALAGPKKDEGFEERVAVRKVTLHSLDYWVIDNGATYSMTPRAGLLTKLEPSPVKHVTSAMGQRAKVKVMGKAMFKGADGKMVGLKNMLWLPNLAANLISVRRLQKVGMDTSSKGAKTYTARIGERFFGTFMRIGMSTTRCRRYMCSEATAKAPLDEVVMDVVGPLMLGAARAEYFLTIVDVSTRMTCVHVLSKKSDVAETVKTDWLSMVERQQNRLVKAIRTDRGGDFLSKEFLLWVKKNGIRHSLTMPYSPAMNGIADRVNWTNTETARRLLIEARLPNNFWPDAVRSARVAKNRALTNVGADKWVPYVEWIGRKPKVDMLRVFDMGPTLKEALESSDAEEWKKAMESELKSIEENGSWELVELPEGRKAITSKWLFKIKSDADGKMERYKSRLVVM